MSLIGRAERGDPGLYCVVCCACDWRGPHGQTHAEADDTATRHAATHRGAVGALVRIATRDYDPLQHESPGSLAREALAAMASIPPPTGGSSSMSGIERSEWTIYEGDGEHPAQPLVRRGYGKADIEGWKRIEVVPAEQLRGAVEEIAAWLQHVDRLDEIPGARIGLPERNVLWDAAEAIRQHFGVVAR
jgi:hypothetical protein